MKRLTAILLTLALTASAVWHGDFGGLSFGRVDAQGGAESAAGQASSDGAMGGANLQRSGVYRTKGVSHPQGVAWKSDVLCKPAEENSYSVPVVSGGMVYVVCGGSRRRLGGDSWIDYVSDEGVYALDAGTGKKIWEFKPKRFTLSGIAVAGGTLYVGSRSDYYGGPAGTLYALDAATGRERWSYKLKKQRLDYVSPAVADGALYFGDLGGNLYALDSATGEAKWVFSAKGELTAPAILDGTVYFGSRKGFAYAVDARTGRQRWGHKLGGVLGHPVVSGGLVYFVAGDESLYALGIETGERVLKVAPPAAVGSFFAVADETIYHAGREKNFYAADARTGREKWSFKTKEYCDTPSVAGGLVYFPCGDGTLYAADARTGEVKWSIGSETLWYYTPSLSDGTIYFMMSDGRLYAVR